MTERPLLLNAEMVRAALDGRKTQTRRPLEIQPGRGAAPTVLFGDSAKRSAGPSWKGQALAVWSGESEFDHYDVHCPMGAPGDRLWVRETHYVWSAGNRDGSGRQISYRATDPDAPCSWTPSIHMPRWASRITLEVTDVRAERLQEITHEDIRDEGIECPMHDFSGGFCLGPCVDIALVFVDLWDSIYGKTHPWDSNPWVWVCEFRRIE